MANDQFLRDKHDAQVDYLEKASSASAHSPISREVEAVDPYTNKRLTRKFDFHILPWLFAIWLLAYIDRANIGNARIDGLTTEIKVLQDGNKFNVALAVFYVPYLIVDIPSNWVLKHFKGGRYLPGLLTAWGLVSLCTGFVTTYPGLLAARFFLGLCEGGILGGIILYLSMFYPRIQLMRRIGFFYCAAPLSGAFGGLLAAGLAEIKTKHFPGWHWIFFVEGALTIIVGLVAAFFLPSTPASARFLSPQDQEAAARRMQVDIAGTGASKVEEEHFSWKAVRMAILNVNTILLSLLFFAIITPIYSYSLFLPTIIKALGYTSLHAQLFTVPPNVCAVFTVLAFTWLSDRIKQRGALMIVGLFIAMAGYIMLIVPAPNKYVHTHYGGTFLVAAGIFPCSPLIMGWLANNLAPHHVRATGVGFQIMVANLAAFLATFTYTTKDAPKYIKGHSINLGMIALAIALCTVTMIYQRWENRLRNKGGRDYRLDGDEDEQELGYRHPSFRYTV